MDEVNYQSSTKHLNLLPLPPLWENKRIGPLIYCQLSFIFLTCESVIMIWVEALSQRNYLILQEIWHLPPSLCCTTSKPAAIKRLWAPCPKYKKFTREHAKCLPNVTTPPPPPLPSSSLLPIPQFWHIFDASTYNHFDNILKLFDVLLNFLFTTSEAKRDYYLQTWFTRVASRVAEQLKT